MAVDYATVDDLVAAFDAFDGQRGTGFTGTQTTMVDGILVRAGTHVTYTEPDPHQPSTSFVYSGICVWAEAGDMWHRIDGADDLRDAIDQCVAHVQRLRADARPQALIDLDRAAERYASASDAMASATATRNSAIRAASSAGHSVGEIAVRARLQTARVYQILAAEDT